MKLSEKVNCATLKKLIEKLTAEQEKTANELLYEMKEIKGKLACNTKVIDFICFYKQ